MRKEKQILTALLLAAVLALAGCKGGADTPGTGPDAAAATQAPVSGDSAKTDVKPTASVTDAAADPAGQSGDAGQTGDTAAEEGLTVTTEVADGWSEKNGVYTITKAGEYTFSGSLSEGRIVVNAKEQEVSVILSGVTLSSKEDSVIYIENAEELKTKLHLFCISQGYD